MWRLCDFSWQQCLWPWPMCVVVEVANFPTWKLKNSELFWTVSPRSAQYSLGNSPFCALTSWSCVLCFRGGWGRGSGGLDHLTRHVHVEQCSPWKSVKWQIVRGAAMQANTATRQRAKCPWLNYMEWVKVKKKLNPLLSPKSSLWMFGTNKHCYYA